MGNGISDHDYEHVLCLFFLKKNTHMEQHANANHTVEYYLHSFGGSARLVKPDRKLTATSNSLSFC